MHGPRQNNSGMFPEQEIRRRRLIMSRLHLTLQKADFMDRSCSLAADAIERGGTNVPVHEVSSVEDFWPSANMGGLRYRVPLGGRSRLDALLVVKPSDVLVVAFHGMMVKDHHHLPRFEWLRTLQKTPYNCLYLSDPTLTLDPKLLLGWYIGWEELDLFPVLASVVSKAAEAVGASSVLLAGSSGGGFASLQVSSYLTGSIAVPFNSQTSVERYRWNAQANFLRRVMPQLEPAQGSRRKWARALGARGSVLQRYAEPRENRILYFQNSNDPHHVNKHYVPFREAIQSSPNQQNIRFELYEGPEAHEPPSPRQFREGIAQALELFGQRH